MKYFIIRLMENCINSLMSQVQPHEDPGTCYYNERLIREMMKYRKIINLIHQNEFNVLILAKIWEEIREYHKQRGRGKLNFFVIDGELQ